MNHELVAGRLAEVRARIERAGGDPDGVEIVAVTKSFGPPAAVAALSAGIANLGENYAGELAQKAAAVAQLCPARARWHFIGAIQRNKIARLAEIVCCWQTIARAIEAETIVGRYGEGLPSVFLEINMSGDPRRPGCHPRAARGLLGDVRSVGLEVRGLMAVAPLAKGPTDIETGYGDVARLRDDLGLAELSIGMSGDLEAAVRAGTTMVRVGSALFGPRNPRAPR
ncbi:MAG: YggS family pyridoxal phosphate enzyme [Acidimicrobiales bacterium]